MNQYSISVVIPAYNEVKVIGATLRDVRTYLLKNFSDFEIIVVDDGSSDATVSEVNKNVDIKLISDKRNRGKGYAVRRGVMASSKDLILFMDADNSTNIRELDNFMNYINDYDILVASRALPESKIKQSQGSLKQMLGRVGNIIIKLILGLSLGDTRCGFKLYRNKIKEIFERQSIMRWSFDDEILYLAGKEGYRVRELPVTWVNNFDSKVKSGDYFKTIIELLKIRFRYILNKY